MSAVQIELDFEGGLTERYPEFRDLVRASVYGCGRPLKAVAADLDYSPSRLSRMLADNPDDPINFPLDRLPDLLQATGDLSPIYWLIERFLEDEESRKRRAIAELQQLLPKLGTLLRSVG